MDRQEGILYIAKGEKFITEARISAEQINSVMKNTPIVLITDQDVEYQCFDEVIVDSKGFSKRDKARLLPETPFESTIFLDTDTYVDSNISELYDIIDRFDIALARDPNEYNVRTSDQNHPIYDVPEGFPEFNSGVIAYRNTPKFKQFCDEWLYYYQPTHQRDQISLRPALYHSSIRIAPLPTRYNCMYRYDNHVIDKVKIFHGQLISSRSDPGSFYGIETSHAVKAINAASHPRVFYTYLDRLFVDPSPSIYQKILIQIQNNGFRSTIARSTEFITRNLLHKDVSSSSLLSRLYWEVRSRVFPVIELRTGEISAKFYVNSAPQAKRIISMMEYEPVLRSLIEDVRPDDTFWDIGAGFGLYSSFILKILETGHVVAFESKPEYARKLHKTLALNGDEAAFDVMEVALTQDDREISNQSIADSNDKSAHQSLNQEKGDSVPATKCAKSIIDDEYSLPDVVKLDTEGSELEVLKGFGQKLSEVRLLYIIVNTPSTSEAVVADLKSYLRSYEFDLQEIGEIGDTYCLRAVTH